MRKKTWLSTLVALVLFLQIFLTNVSAVQYFYDGGYHEYKGNIFKLQVNGKILKTEMPPIVFDGYSVVPARAVFQDGLGAKVEWDGMERKVIVTMDDAELILTIDERTALLNGEEVRMPIAAKIINDYTMIPARFVGENLGMEVDFDNSTDTVILNGKEKSTKVTDVVYSEESRRECLLTIETDTLRPKYRDYILTDPMRLVIDVEGAVYSKIPNVIDAENGNVRKIRFGQQAECARIVVDLTEDLGYVAAWDGKDIVVYIDVDPYAEPDDNEAPNPSGSATPTPTTKPTGSENPSASPTATPKPPITDIFKVVTYGYEGSRDYIKFGEVKFGEAEVKGKTLTIPVYGELPQKAAEKKVNGFYGSSMSYEPNEEGDGGTITVKLKNTDMEVYTEKNEVRMRSVHKALKRSVMLDAGHGGTDSGAVGYEEDGSIRALEKDFNLDVVLRVKELLEAEDVDVHTIRTEDVYVDYLRVGSIANDTGVSLFVSVHTNSAPVPQANGIESLGYLGTGAVSNGMTSQRLCDIMQENLIEKTGAHSRGVKDRKDLAVLNSTKMPATLIEMGFISNYEECTLLMTEAYRQEIAEAIAESVLEAFDEMGI